jgi:hypothetical protein
MDSTLDDLDKVDWTSVSHAYGLATDVPDTLRKLTSPDDEILDEALEHLFSSIWHQDTVYSATAFAVTFLVQLLTEAKVGGRTKYQLITLLREISRGSGYFIVHYELDPQWSDQYLASEGTNIERQRQQEMNWVRAAREAVIEGVPTYLTLLRTAGDEVRSVIPNLLSGLVEGSADIIPALKVAYAAEQRLALKASCLLVVHQNQTDG